MALAFALTACGRIGFDSMGISDDGSSIDSPGNDAQAPPWSLVQVSGSLGASTTFGTPTAPGDLVVVLASVGIAGDYAVTNSALDSFSIIAAPSQDPVSDEQVLMFFAITTGGATGATLIGTATMHALVAWEFGPGTLTFTYETGTSSGGLSPASLTPETPAITTAKDGEIVVAALLAPSFNITGMDASDAVFTNDALIGGNGWAHLSASSAAGDSYRAIWDQSTSQSYLSAALWFSAR